MHLICLPYAGGSAAIFRDLPALLPDMQVHAVELPGRGRRLAEPAHTSMDTLATQLLEELAPFFEEPFALLGHSMGGALAFEVARRLPPQAAAHLRHMFLSAARAPGQPRPGNKLQHLNDADFKDELRRLGGTPVDVLNNDELMALLLPMLRADFTLVENYVPAPGVRVSADLTVLAGRQDTSVTHENAAAWHAFTQGQCELREVDGDHFFLKPQMPLIAEIIRTRLAQVTS